MICPKCHNEFEVDNSQKYTCHTCGLSLPVEFYGYKLTQDDIDSLVLNGETKEISFYSRARKKRFKTKLVLKDGQVDFAFKENSSTQQENMVLIFINALASGLVRVLTVDSNEKSEKIFDFGTTATRYAEVLALIAVLPLIEKDKKLRIVADNPQFVKYILGEETPKDKEIRFGVNTLIRELKNYEWQAELNAKGFRLKGGNSKIILQNLFPYINVKKVSGEKGIIVEMENCNLAVEKHFMEYIPKARKLDKGKFIVPFELEWKLSEWEKVYQTDVEDKRSCMSDDN